MRRVAIIGSNQSRHQRRKADQNVEEIIYETVRGLLDRASLDIRDVDAVIGAGDDVMDGRSISNVFTSEYAGAFLKEESKVEDDGAYASSYAFMRIASGACETALVYGYSKGSDSSPQHYSGMIADPLYLRPLGVEAITSAALQAQCYFIRYGVTAEQAAPVAVKNRKNALLNPYAQLHIPNISVEMAMSSMMLSTPIKLLDSCPASDGACATGIASEGLGEKYADRPAWVKAVATFNEGVYNPGRNFADPRREIDVAELYEAFSFQEMLWTEAMFFCERGEGGKLVESGATQMTGDWAGTILDIEKFVPGSDPAGVREATTAQPLKEVRGQVSIPYRWSYGTALTRFFQESRDNKRLMGTRCPRCRSVTVPAARICTRCFVETTEWVEVSDHGVLETYTTVHLPFPGQPTEPPYTFGLILLDGASTYFSHLIEGPAEALRCGMRVQAVWPDERKGDLFDILYFKQEES